MRLERQKCLPKLINHNAPGRRRKNSPHQSRSNSPQFAPERPKGKKTAPKEPLLRRYYPTGLERQRTAHSFGTPWHTKSISVCGEICDSNSHSPNLEIRLAARCFWCIFYSFPPDFSPTFPSRPNAICIRVTIFGEEWKKKAALVEEAGVVARVNTADLCEWKMLRAVAATLAVTSPPKFKHSSRKQ